MKFFKFTWILSCSLIFSLMFGCKSEKLILHGEISGIVTDTKTNLPLQDVAIKLIPVNDTTSTGIDGKYLFKSLYPQTYILEATKQTYDKKSFTIRVDEAKTAIADIVMEKVPYIEVSARNLDFGSDAIFKNFTIKNIGGGKLQYSLTAKQDWITVDPRNGTAEEETDTIRITVDRTGMSETSHRGTISIISYPGSQTKEDTLDLLLNYIKDKDMNYYGTVRIGTQVWMDENLKTGTMIELGQLPSDNGILEKYCHGNTEGNCEIYGGLYSWEEMRDYYPSGEGDNIIQGICPDGWHIPSNSDWGTLINYVGGDGGKLKEKGFSHWKDPNTGATDEFGFRALPSSCLLYCTRDCGSLPVGFSFLDLGLFAAFWSVNNGSISRLEYSLYSWDNIIEGWVIEILPEAYSVRCIKDPPKNK